MHRLKLMTAVAAALLTSPALAQEITVWDVNVDEPSSASYYAGAKAAFEAAHPGPSSRSPMPNTTRCSVRRLHRKPVPT